MKKALFSSLLRSLLITFDDIESGKRKYCFGKKSGNGLEFGIPKYVQNPANLKMVRYSRGAFFWENP